MHSASAERTAGLSPRPSTLFARQDSEQKSAKVCQHYLLDRPAPRFLSNRRSIGWRGIEYLIRNSSAPACLSALRGSIGKTEEGRQREVNTDERDY